MNYEIVRIWGTPTVQCFAGDTPDLCYLFSSTATDSMLMPQGWVGESVYLTYIDVPAVAEFSAPVAAVPEPSAAVLLGAGLILLMWLRRFGYRPEAAFEAPRQRSA